MTSSLGESCGYVLSMNETMTGVGWRNVQPMRNLLLYSQTAMLYLDVYSRQAGCSCEPQDVSGRKL